MSAWWVRHFGSRRLQRDFDAQWGELARYNSEVARGILHTPEHRERMALQQAAFDARGSYPVNTT